MRIELWLWLASAGIVLVGGMLRLRSHRGELAHRSRLFGLIVSTVGVCLGLICAVIGLAWQVGNSAGWPGGTPANALAMLASGALAASLWNLGADLRASAHQKDDPERRHAGPESLALFGVCLLLLLAAGLAWLSPSAVAPSPTVRWLFNLRGILVAIGLGGWLCALADHLWNLRPRFSDSGWESASSGPGPAAMQFSYPWLTAGWLAGLAWNLAIYVTLWRGLPAELWLLVAWLLGGIYLCAIWALPRPDHDGRTGRISRLREWTLVLLAALGTAAAFLALIWTSFLLS